MFEVGRICTKRAGRDSGLLCVIVDSLKEGMVLIDGQTRRRTCNIIHLIPSDKTLDIKKGASHEEVAEAFKSLKIDVRTTTPKKAAARPKKVRKAPVKKAEAKAPVKKVTKKTPKKE